MRERLVEHDSVVSAGALRELALDFPERVSGSGRDEVDSLRVTPRVHHSGFAADLVGAAPEPSSDGYDMFVVRLAHGLTIMSNLVGIKPGAIKCAMSVELVLTKINSQVTLPNFHPRISS